MREFIKEESGTTAIEYALIASMMTMVLAGALSTLRDGVSSLYSLAAVLTGAAI